MRIPAWLVYIGFACLAVLALAVLQPILLPFIVGFAIAYFLDPVVEWLARQGVSRTIAALALLGGFVALVVISVVLLLPLVQRQILSFADNVPQYVDAVMAWSLPLVNRLESLLSPDDLARLRGLLSSGAGDALRVLAQVLTNIWSGSVAFLNLLSLIFITPLVGFYLLRDWDRILTKIDGWLPRDHAPVIRQLAGEIDRTLAGFVRGQGVVMLCLATFYSVGLTVLNLDFGLIIGIAAGLASFIPFLGAAFGLVVSVGMALVQFGLADWTAILMVAAVFAAGQILEGNVLTPRLVGRRVGLHPVWVIFAVLAGGVLMGFVGVLLAVPAAAVTGVVMRFALESWRRSPGWRGVRSDRPPDDTGA
jgi:predicted PurR-regulated permease PerM